MLGDPIKDAYIAVIGVAGAGKSSFISTCAGSKPHKSEYYDPQYATREIENVDFMYNDSLRVHLIDTPGFSDIGDKADADILKSLMLHLMEISKQEKKLSGVVLVHPISAQKAIGPSLLHALMLMRLYTDSFHESVALVTSNWSGVRLDEGRRREREMVENNKFFSSMTEMGSKMFRYDDSRQSALDIVSHVLHADRDISLGVSAGSLEGKQTIPVEGKPGHAMPMSEISDGAGELDADLMEEIERDLLELVPIHNQLQSMRECDDKVLELYREQVKKLAKEVEEGAYRQHKLTQTLQQVIDVGDRELQEINDKMGRMALDREQDRLRFEREKDEQLRSAEANMRHAEAAFAQRHEEGERARRDELDRVKRELEDKVKAAEDEKARIEAVCSKHREDCDRKARDEVERAKNEHDERLRILHTEMARGRLLMEQERIRQLDSVRSELSHEMEERDRKMQRDMEHLKSHLDQQRAQEVDAVRTEGSLKLGERERQMSLDMSHQAAALEKRRSEEVLALRTELTSKAEEQESIMRKEIEQLKIALALKSQEMDTERAEMVRKAEKREKAVRLAVERMMEESKRQHQESLRVVQEEVSRWEQERRDREERDRLAQKEMARWSGGLSRLFSAR